MDSVNLLKDVSQNLKAAKLKDGIRTFYHLKILFVIKLQKYNKEGRSDILLRVKTKTEKKNLPQYLIASNIKRRNMAVYHLKKNCLMPLFQNGNKNNKERRSDILN